MSLTIIQQPQKFSPVYNEIIFVTSGTNNTQTNYLYVADLFLPGSATYDFRLKVPARPDGYGVFDIQSIVRNYITSNIEIIDSPNEGFKRNLNSYKAFVVKLGEEFGSTPVVYPNIATSGTVLAHNAVVDFLDFQSYNQNDHIMQVSGKSFLTNSPASQAIGYDENAWLYFMVDGVGVVGDMQIAVYDGSTTTHTLLNIYSLLVDDDSRFIRIPCGTRNLNKTSLGTIINSNTISYTIKLRDGANTVSEIKTFVLNANCTKYTSRRFHFLNKWGGFDSFTFLMKSRQNISIDRKKYKKVVGELSSGAYGYSKSDRGEVIYATTLKDKFSVESDWITEAQATWLEELITSPEVYLEIDNELVAITIINSEYEPKKTANDSVFNLRLDFEMSYNRYRQNA